MYIHLINIYLGSGLRFSSHHNVAYRPSPANTHSFLFFQLIGKATQAVPLTLENTTRPALAEICASDLSAPLQHPPCPHLAFIVFGSPSYFLAQAERSLQILENRKSMFLNLPIPFQVICKKKKVELSETRSSCSKTMIYNITIAFASVSQ